MQNKRKKKNLREIQFASWSELNWFEGKKKICKLNFTWNIDHTRSTSTSNHLQEQKKKNGFENETPISRRNRFDLDFFRFRWRRPPDRHLLVRVRSFRLFRFRFGSGIGEIEDETVSEIAALNNSRSSKSSHHSSNSGNCSKKGKDCF